MIFVIVGLAVLLIAVLVAVVGVLGNSGTAHPLTETFSVFGYHVTGSTGTLFVFGMVVGAIAMLGLSVLLAGARHTVDADATPDATLPGPKIFGHWSEHPPTEDQPLTNHPR